MAGELRFDGQVVVVTGAGSGLGRAYALLFGSRGAKVVVNDLGGGFNGDGSPAKNMADTVVEDIEAAGGRAVADYNDVANGDQIIGTAIKAFGTVHVLINNAGILRDVSFKNMKDKDWDLIQRVHMFGTYKTTRAAWPFMQAQKYGRIICTSSGAGTYGSFGQTNYSAAKAGIIGFTKALAKEGMPYNIRTNVIAPAAASRLTATVMPPDLLQRLGTEFVAPVVIFLAHRDSQETGGIFELGGGFVSKFRWQRSGGGLMSTDDSLTPSAVSHAWEKIADFSEYSYPDGPVISAELLGNRPVLKPNRQDEDTSLAGKVALVTGAATELGCQYAMLLGKLGAKVVVNDPYDADTVVHKLREMGVEVVGVKNSMQDGDAIIKTAISAFGSIHVIVNCAGTPRGGNFDQMRDEIWKTDYENILRGNYKVLKAAWPYMLKQKYGRIINTTSPCGLYGQVGQSAFSAAAMATFGFSRALSREGQKYNIHVNIIMPGTEPATNPEHVASVVVFLCSENPNRHITGGVYEIGPGWIGKMRWQRSNGHHFPINEVLKPEAVRDNWHSIVHFDQMADNPDSAQDGMKKMLENSGNSTYTPIQAQGQAKRSGHESQEVLRRIEIARKSAAKGMKYAFNSKDVILYNLSVGAQTTDLHWVFEESEGFEVIPTFGVIPQLAAVGSVNLDFLPDYSPKMLLHGEQYLEIKKWPIPTSGYFTSSPRILEVIDKGSAAVVVTATSTVLDSTGEQVFYNESTAFIRGSGGFGGNKKGSDRGFATAANKPPTREADRTVSEKTSENQAAVYRLNGDLNPLHIDPKLAKEAGFDAPILHGLCSFGISGKHLLATYGRFKSIKVRFAGTVLPGQTLRTEMWKEDDRVLFQTVVVETGKLAISNGAAQLVERTVAKL